MTDKEQIECSDPVKQTERLKSIIHRLRSKGGCPWDAEQTHESLIPCMIEEAYEAVDTMRRGDMPHMKEELGDVLLQVVFHAELASETGDFDFNDVAQSVSDKMIRRHPHVYAKSEVKDTDGVLSQWDSIKKWEKGAIEAESYLDGVGNGLPAILKATKLQKKAAKVGFDWPDSHSIFPKIEEELQEVKDELDLHNEGDIASEALKDEIGDLLFVVANLARKLKLNPEDLIDRTSRKFVRRFNAVEKGLKDRGLELSAESNSEMEEIWLEQRNLEK